LPAFRAILSRSIVTGLLLTIPSAVGLFLLGESMIGIVYQHGRFAAFDTHQTSIALWCYAPGLAGYAAIKLLAPAFYALGDARTPMFVSLGSVVVNAVSANALAHYSGLGFAGLALSLSLVSTVNALALASLIRRRTGGIDGRVIASSAIRILLATAVMAAAVHGVTMASHALVASAKLARIADVAFGVPAGALVFYAAASALGIPEIQEARESLLRRFGKAR
ncbi:MAG TPA: lipid II flippase MurJ, partial [Bryobacteraceae bacterium]|nr:lipid II flippase MurJ [Bryobacteraceae bacterium]